MAIGDVRKCEMLFNNASQGNGKGLLTEDYITEDLRTTVTFFSNGGNMTIGSPHPLEP
jgi:hypothetical protein